MKRFKRGVLLGVLSLLFGGVISAQVLTGTISGTVKDPSGAVLPGAKIEVLNQDTGGARTVETDGSGHYSATSLTLGSYRITTAQAGFQTEVRSGIVLTVGREAVVDVTLSVGASTQTVEVTAEAATIETTSSTVSGFVSGEQMRNLPLNGRSWTDLALLNPGVMYNRTTGSAAADGFGVRLSVNSSRSTANQFLMDGALTNDHSGSSGNVSRLSLGVEGIREFRMLTHNYSAEYGRYAGSVVSAVTRSGTNQFHGSLYEFLRNNVFDTRDFFNPGDLPAYRRNQFGGAIGGPVVKDRVFFFFNYEGLRERRGITIVSTVPDLDARKGLLRNPANGQLVPASPFNPAVIPYLNLYPVPNGVSFGDGTAQSSNNWSQPATENYWMQRGDFRLSDKDNLFVRYVFNPSTRQRSTPTPVFFQLDDSTNHFASLSETHIFSANAINEFRFSFNRTVRTGDLGPTSMPIDPSLSFNPGYPFGQISFTATGIGSGPGAGGLSTLGYLSGGPNGYAPNTFQTAETVSLTRGAHSMKFGFALDRQQMNISSNGANIRGTFQFTSLQTLLAGTPNQLAGRVTGVLPSGNIATENFGYRNWYLAWFVHDDYRVNSRLTLNLGFRHEFLTDISDVHGATASLVNITDTASTLGPPFHYSKKNFAPRVGVAWDPTGSGKNSVRFGAGVYYNQVVGREALGTDSRFSGAYTITNPTTFPRVPAVVNLTGAATASPIQYYLPTPIVVQYGLDIQRQLTSTLTARIGYVGWWGDNLTRITQQNTRVPRIAADGTKSWTAPLPARINPLFGNITQTRADTWGNYNGLQFQLQQALRSGLMFGASYTLSKGLTTNDSTNNRNADNGGIWVSLDKDDPGRDYGRSTFDQRHTFVFNSQYQLTPLDRMLKGGIAKAVLGGWAINGVWQYGSGLPLNINVAFNNSQDGNNSNPDRPNVTPGATNDPTHGVTTGCGGVIPAGQELRTPNRWFDPCAFVLPTLGFQGNLGRNTVSGPNFSQIDFTLVKKTALTERMNLEFRVESFNLFNHPSFGIPQIQVFNSSRVHTGNEGVITTTVSGGRQLQLGMKLSF